MTRIWKFAIVSLICAMSPMALAQTEFVVPPSGGDDTATIQAAFDAAVVAGPGSTVRLQEGTYCVYSPVIVRGFVGSWVGAGQGQTTVKTCAEIFPVPAYIEADPAHPGDPLLEIISPFVFIEVDGKPSQDVHISDMAVNLEGETNPWLAHGLPLPLTIFRPGISFAGSRPSVVDGVISTISLKVERFDLIGNADGTVFGEPYETNIDNGIEIRGGIDGTIFQVLDVEPVKANVSIKSSYFKRVAFSALQVVSGVDSNVVFGGRKNDGNTLSAHFGAVVFLDLISGSSVKVSHNQGDTQMGPFVRNVPSPYVPEVTRSLIEISKNSFRLFPAPINPSLGPSLVDLNLLIFGQPAMRALIEDNVISQTNIGYGTGSLVGIDNVLANDTIIQNNKISGEYTIAGIAAGYVDGPPPAIADAIVIKGNNLSGTTASVAPVWLGPYSSNSLVVGGPNSRHVFDQGYDNIVTGVTNTGGSPPGPMFRDLVGRIQKIGGIAGWQ